MAPRHAERREVLVTIYGGRRNPEVGLAAHGLAQALRARLAPQPVTLYVDPAVRLSVPDSVRRVPANIKGALGSLAAGDHAVLALVGPVTEQVITAFDLSSWIVVVTDASVPSLRAAQRTFTLCSSVGYPQSRVLAALLLDEAGHGDLDTIAVAQVLKRDIACTFPRPPIGPAAEASCRDLAARMARTA